MLTAIYVGVRGLDNMAQGRAHWADLKARILEERDEARTRAIQERVRRAGQTEGVKQFGTAHLVRPRGMRASDEWVPYVAVLLAFFLLVQGAADGKSPPTFWICAGVYLVSTLLVQAGTTATPIHRLGNSVVLTLLLALLGVGLSLALS